MLTIFSRYFLRILRNFAKMRVKFCGPPPIQTCVSMCPQPQVRMVKAKGATTRIGLIVDKTNPEALGYTSLCSGSQRWARLFVLKQVVLAIAGSADADQHKLLSDLMDWFQPSSVGGDLRKIAETFNEAKEARTLVAIC